MPCPSHLDPVQRSKLKGKTLATVAHFDFISSNLKHTRSLGDVDEDGQHESNESPLRQNGDLVVQGVRVLHNGQHQRPEKAADTVPKAVGQDHGAANVGRSPLGDIDGEGRLDAADTHASKELCSSPVCPVRDKTLDDGALGEESVSKEVQANRPGRPHVTCRFVSCQGERALTPHTMSQSRYIVTLRPILSETGLRNTMPMN